MYVAHNLAHVHKIQNIFKILIMGRRKAGFRRFHKNYPDKDERKPYESIIRENEKFVAYYKKQGVCPESEWDDFISSLKSDLPATFRITGSKSEAKRMLEIIQGQFLKNCLSQNEDAQEKTKIFPLPWYPNQLAWQMNISRNDIRRVEAYYKLHGFLISETENGSISRQETVSMIPPLVLDVQPHHKVLDMCAAPGSKTAQLIEMLHATDDPIPSGYVVANDVDNKRCYMLVHQAKRINSPCVAIINHDSAVLPNMEVQLTDGGTEQVRFDRVLCDVPCSGDGTLRKNPDIWMKWSAANGLNLHGIQYRILRRGAELLSVGGRLVYSTCSLNPLENESVIHRILAETDGALQLVDVTANLPGLKYIPGMQSWLIGTKTLEFFESFEEVPEKWITTIRPQMFPPKPDDRSKFNLNRCIRILPHQQNTGAFFVAVLEKVKPLNAKQEFLERIDDKGDGKRQTEDNFGGARKKRKKGVFKEDPFVFFKNDEPVWNEIKEFYKVSDEFDATCLLTRCHVGKKKNIYLTSGGIRDLVLHNQQRIKFINTGVKAFVRSDNRNMKCAFRIAQDALDSIFAFVGPERKIKIPKDDLITLLLNDTPEKSPEINTLSEFVQKQVENLSPGSCLLVYKEESGENPLTLNMSGWRGTKSLRCYMTQFSTVHLLRLLGADTSKYDVNKFKKADNELEETNGGEEKDEAMEEEEDASKDVENTNCEINS